MILTDLSELIDKYVILPTSILTFFILIYIVIYLSTNNPDVIRSKIFLNYSKLRIAFSLFVIFAFFLIIHVALVYKPHIFYFIFDCSLSEAYELQHIFGLILSLILISFVGMIYKCIK